MVNLLDRCKRLWNDFLGRPTGPSLVRVVPLTPAAPPGQPAPGPPKALEVERDYWQVRIAQMYLHDAVGWFKTHDPLVIVVSEFAYDGVFHAVPKIVGPGLLAQLGGQHEPLGMVYRDTRVAGLYPFPGGRINLSLVLCRAERSDLARTLLSVLESTGAALDLAAEVSPYLRIGSVLLDGLEKLRASDDVKPLAGHRKEYDTDAGEWLGPMQVYLATTPEHGRVALAPSGQIVASAVGAPVDAQRLMWVHDQLCYLWDDNLCYPYRASDFVVAELRATAARTDLSLLPCWAAWKQVLRDAGCGTAVGLEMAQTGLRALYQQMLHSPDLTRAHVDQKILEWKAEMLKAYQVAEALGTRDGEQKGPAALEANLQRQALDLFAEP